VGIPAAADVRLREGAVVVKPLDAPLAEVLTIVADPRHASYASAVEALADQVSQGDRQQLANHAAELSRLAVAGAPEVRVLAVRGIARGRDLGQGPLLIHLLRDADARVVRAASESLGEISRKYTDFGLGPEPTPERRERAIAEWKSWYRSVRPDVDLESYDPMAALR
jgi:HEAT repeat protein